MQLPVRPQSGKRIPKNWFRDLYDYIAAATTLRGDSRNIAVRMTDAGQVIRFIGNSRSAPGGGMAASLPVYDGPLAVKYRKTVSAFRELSLNNGGIVNLNGETLYPSNMSLDVTSITTGTHTVWLSIVDYGSISLSLQLALDLSDSPSMIDRRFNFLLATWNAETNEVTQIWNAPQIVTLYAESVNI